MEKLEIYKWFINQGAIMQASTPVSSLGDSPHLGSSLVFLFKNPSRKILDISLGFTGGVMMAASFWSLLSPAISYVEMQNEMGLSSTPSWIPPAIGFFFGSFISFCIR